MRVSLASLGHWVAESPVCSTVGLVVPYGVASGVASGLALPPDSSETLCWLAQGPGGGLWN